MFNATAVNIYGSSLTATSISILAGASATPTPKEEGSKILSFLPPRQHSFYISITVTVIILNSVRCLRLLTCCSVHFLTV